MTILERIFGVWRRMTPASGPDEPLQLDVKNPQVPAEYLPLHKYLQSRHASMVVLTFRDMESLLGFALPAPAKNEGAWWTDPASRSARHSDAWIAADRVATPNLPAGIVSFERP